MDPSQRMFGDARIGELVSRHASNGVGILDALLGEIRAFEAGSAPSDDLAAILLRLEAL